MASDPAPRAFESVAERIRGELVSGSFAPGDRLPSERALSEQYGVSRNTLREALRSLEHAGLIRLQKGATGGAFVTGTSGRGVASGLRDLYEFGAVDPSELTQARIWLEAIVIREACPRATPDDLARLTANVDAVEAAGDDFLRRVELHLDFHRLLARATGNAILVSVMDGLLDAMRSLALRIGDHPDAYTLPSRRRFLERFAAGDGAGASAEMEENLLRLQRFYLARAAQSSEGVLSSGMAMVVRRAPEGGGAGSALRSSRPNVPK